MASKSAIRFAILGVGILLVYIVLTTMLPSDRKKIESQIEKARVACEEEDLATLMGVFDLGYRDDAGLTYAAWRILFAKSFEKYDDIRIRIVDLRIGFEEGKDEARATLSVRGEGTVASTKTSAEALADRPIGAADEVRLHFKKTPLGWRVKSAENLRQDVW